ncbi:hypothetical protein SLS53_004509 [Cytospora paraplurivora]|uniref:Uncharacterized protein n=1 Tax=Cytospora paraplurivora TaxID=2898453 RepID=A0AAN9UAU9_9PEZI
MAAVDIVPKVRTAYLPRRMSRGTQASDESTVTVTGTIIITITTTVDITDTAHAPAELPFKARPLSHKHDLDAFEPLFAYYLDIQKGKDFYELDSHEARGRWKSFVNKWNRAELAEGWYDPEMFERVVREAPARSTRPHVVHEEKEETYTHDTDEPQGLQESSTPAGSGRDGQPDVYRDARDENEEDEDDYIPPLPPGQQPAGANSGGTSRHGPGIPTTTDLMLQREADAEAHESRVSELRLARKADRAQQKERLDEIIPRAEPGTRERKLEKKALVNDKMRAFREKGDAMEEVGEGDLMGGGDSLDDYRRAAKEQQRKKTDRELRREAEARAKAEEREQRLREWREREEEKLRGLKELARARFG